MRINVKAKPLSSIEKVEKVGQNSFEVWVKEPPVKGFANMAIRGALAEYFNVSHAKVGLFPVFPPITKSSKLAYNPITV